MKPRLIAPALQFPLVLALILSGLPAQQPRAGSAALAASAELHLPGLGLTVRVTKTFDAASGALESRAHVPGGGLVDLAALRASELAAKATSGARIHPLLAQQLDRAGGAPVRVGIWLDFDPADVDHRREYAQERARGVPRREALATMREHVAQGNRIVLDPGLNLLAHLGLPLHYADPYAPILFTEATAAQVQVLAEQPQVAALYPSLEAQPCVSSSRATHRWNRVIDHGLRGDGVRVAIVEGGLIDTNGTAINVVGSRVPGGAIDAHATEVAFVCGSDHPIRPGFARGVEILSANTIGGSSTDFFTACSWALGQGAQILNVSLGWTTNLTVDILDRYVDYQARYNTATFTPCAGNDGATTGHVKSPGLAWNGITVGASWDHGTTSWLDDEIADFSSYVDPISLHGDREKPEVVAVGHSVQVYSAGGADVTVFGTSFSAPAVAGMAACLMQAEPAFDVAPEALKAALMASATNNVDGASRLSDKDGAGCINGLQALRIVEQRQLEYGTFYSGSFSNNGYYTKDVFLQGGDLTRIVLCWTSDADSSYATDVLDADLDLVVFPGQGSTWPAISASTSWDNNYEIVEFCPTSTGWYTVGVAAPSWSGSSEPYGLAWTQDTDGRYPHFRPRYPDDAGSDLVGPTIGNTGFILGPYDRYNDQRPYVCLASGGHATGIDLPGCAHLPIDPDLVADLSVMPGNPYFHDFIGTLDTNGEALGMHMSIPDLPMLVGLELKFGVVTLWPVVTSQIHEIGVVESLKLWGHAVDLQLGDDDSQAVNLGFAFPFFGNTYSIAYVNSNGNVTFTGPDTSYSESVPAFRNGGPRIAPFWDDLDPTLGGTIRARFAGDSFVIEWVNVPEYGTTTQNSATLILHQSGKIEIKYRDCALQDALVGISPGNDPTGYPLDLTHGSRYPDPLSYLTPPAIYEEFTPSSPFDLGISDDRRTTLTFTPTGYAAGNYRMTVDL